MTCPTCSHHDHPGLPYCGRVVRCFDEDCDADFHHCACAYPDDNAAWVPPVQEPTAPSPAARQATVEHDGDCYRLARRGWPCRHVKAAWKEATAASGGEL